MEKLNTGYLYNDKRIPNWGVIIIAIITGIVVYYFSTRNIGNSEPIKQTIEVKTAKRDSIISSVKNNSTQAAKKGDSLVKLLKNEPWRLSPEDMKDSTIVKYLKNYRYEE